MAIRATSRGPTGSCPRTIDLGERADHAADDREYERTVA